MSTLLHQPQFLNQRKSPSPAKLSYRDGKNSRKTKTSHLSVSTGSNRVASISPLRTNSKARDRKSSQKKVKSLAAPIPSDNDKNKILDIQRIFNQNQNSLEVLQIPQYADKIYDQKSLDNFLASNNVIHPQTLERIQALVDLEKNMNALEIVLSQKDKQIIALQDELKGWKAAQSIREVSPSLHNPSIQVTRSSPDREFLRSRVDSGAGAALATEGSPYGLPNHLKSQSVGG